MPDNFELIVNDKTFEGWETVSFKKSLENLCGSFSLGVTDRWSQKQTPWQIKEGDAATIRINDGKILTGYIDKADVDLSLSGTRISVIGRDKTADLVDCSAINTPGSWKKTTFINIARALVRPFGIFIDRHTVKLTGNKIDFTLETGEKVFEALERLARDENVLFASDPDGNILLLPSENRERTKADLEYGLNIKSVKATFDHTNRYSRYIVKGQNSGKGKDPWSTTKTSAISAEVEDSDIVRYRPLLQQADSNASSTTAKKRANWEKVIRKARGFGVVATVQGWTQAKNTLWEINQICRVKIHKIGIDQDLLISEVSYNKSLSGTEAVLKLVPPDSYTKEPQKVKQNKANIQIAWR